jgi:hypothetical protein
MRIINVVEQLQGTITQILSFPVYEEQLSQDVVTEAENLFKGIINEVTGIDPDSEDMEMIIEDGYYTDDNGWDVSLVWSETN